MNKCKAKNPYDCPYHSREKLKSFKESIVYWEGQLPSANSFEEYEEITKRIETNKARIDANEKGFRQLTKELKQTHRAGDNGKAAEIAHSLTNAAQARLKDGVEGEWDSSYDSYYSYGSKVLALAETTDDVRVPYSLSGTSNILSLYSRVLNEGYEVVSVDSHDSKFEKFTPENKVPFFKEIQAREVDIRNGNYSAVWDDLFEKQGRYLRGLTFVKDGRTIRVRNRSNEAEFASRFDV